MLQHETLRARNSYLLEACRSVFQKQAPAQWCVLALIQLCIKVPWHWVNLLLNGSNQVVHSFTSFINFLSKFLSQPSSGLQSMPSEGDISCSVSQRTLISFHLVHFVESTLWGFCLNQIKASLNACFLLLYSVALTCTGMSVVVVVIFPEGIDRQKSNF